MSRPISALDGGPILWLLLYFVFQTSLRFLMLVQPAHTTWQEQV